MSTYASEVILVMVCRVDEDPLDLLMMRKHGYIPLHSIASDAAPALSPESTFFVECYPGVPDEAPPPPRALLVLLLLSFLSCVLTLSTLFLLLMTCLPVSLTQLFFL